MLSGNPMLGVSARIVEDYARSDGRFFPAAIQHVLGTLDPRIPDLGPGQPVEMSNHANGRVIDLSRSSWDDFAPEEQGSLHGLTAEERIS